MKDYYSLLHLTDDYRVSELRVEKNNWLAEKDLNAVDLASEGIIVLGIKRGNGKYIGAPVGDTRVKKDDVLILYGRIRLLEKLEKRKEGSSGDQEHRDAVNEQEEIERTQENE